VLALFVVRKHIPSRPRRNMRGIVGAPA
jgi:hypothetical protein